MGRFRPREVACDDLGGGAGGLRHGQHQAALSDVRIGDTITDAAPARVRGARRLQGADAQVVYCGLFPATHNQFEDLRTAPPEALAQRRQLHLRARKSSDALGFGFRCGFLGMLHMEIIQQRLERESDIALVQTAPNVTYEILTTRGETLHIANPDPDPRLGRRPGVPRADRPNVNFLGAGRVASATIMQMCEDRRGIVPQDRVHHDRARDPLVRAAPGRDDLRPLR